MVYQGYFVRMCANLKNIKAMFDNIVVKLFFVMQVAVKHVAKTKVGEWTEVSQLVITLYASPYWAMFVLA